MARRTRRNNVPSHRTVQLDLIGLRPLIISSHSRKRLIRIDRLPTYVCWSNLWSKGSTAHVMPGSTIQVISRSQSGLRAWRLKIVGNINAHSAMMDINNQRFITVEVLPSRTSQGRPVFNNILSHGRFGHTIESPWLTPNQYVKNNVNFLSTTSQLPY